jgi:HSP20 family protein
MLMRTDPFRELDRLTQQVLGGGRPSVMPMDAFRKGDQFYVYFDLPGVDRDSIEVTVEKNVLTVKAERPATGEDGVETIVAELPSGTFTRQLFLGDTLDTERIQADYHDGVLALTIPVQEAAKPRRVAVTSGDRQKELAAVS